MSVSKQLFEEAIQQLEATSGIIQFGRKKKVYAIRQNIEQAQSDVQALENRHGELVAESKEWEGKINQLEEQWKSDRIRLETATNQVEELKDEKKTIQGDLEKTQAGLHETTTKLHNSEMRLHLVNSILAASPPANSAMDTFRKLAEEDFIQFANAEASLKEEAEAILSLQHIVRDMQMQVNFASIYNKNIISVGGGFSAGKSEFISSFFDEKHIKLPIGIQPMTAIPTYVVASHNKRVVGYSYHGGAIEIPSELHESMSHEFIQSFAFNLKDILPFMAYETPVTGYNHLCFMDTPGYNPADTTGHTGKDKETARDFLEQSEVLLWLIGLDAGGTIPNSDLEFLNALNLDNKKLYLIANKADLRSEDDLQDILDVFEEILVDEDIEYEGISAYSSIHCREMTYRKNSLHQFLDSQNHGVKTRKAIMGRLSNLFAAYDQAITADIAFNKSIQSQLNSIDLDLLESGAKSNSSNLYLTDIANELSRFFSSEKNVYKEDDQSKIELMKKMFSQHELEKHLNHLRTLEQKMIKAATEVLDTL